ncbi:hypothetical protein KDL01_30195 [Actinospica durhamensis]|uniref:OmpR/PhoB-type domain-containing protein n=1 Tax=Actinospica durhamensis TaxID=1508375 RepID=A0A941F009_9ACTN|nr:helix-turn-helix domain-containing protein [Actinospica durhamensis]MBR7837589.1 hypothetical protein [Actinospica durhamensis]
MSGDWLAEAGDPVASAREIARARDAFLAGEPGAPACGGIRDVVARSWERSARARVDPDKDPPVTLAGADLDDYRRAHPLAAVIGLLRELVGAVAQDGRHLMAVSDASGRLLWVEGHTAELHRAEAMNFVEGAVWDESHAGTNAPGTALVLDHAVQIFSAEHFLSTVSAWTCAAAPIHDPATGRILGIVDVTGGDIVAHPHSLALVSAAARAVEAQLGAVRPGAPAALWLPPGPRRPAPPYLHALGRDHALVTAPERGYATGSAFAAEPELTPEPAAEETRLNRRSSELMVILALHPEGLTADQLASALYDDGAAEATVRVEVNRLRHALTGGLVRSRPYRLGTGLAADFLEVARALREKDAAAALAAYAGPLLPRSEAPAVVAERHWIDAHVRTAVLDSGDPDLIEDWLGRFGGEDLDAWTRLARLLPPGARRADALAEARRLDTAADPWRALRDATFG